MDREWMLDHQQKDIDPFLHHQNLRHGHGLSICRSLIESHGGALCFNSQLGKGTSFYFTLPIHRTSEHNETAVLLVPKHTDSISSPAIYRQSGQTTDLEQMLKKGNNTALKESRTDLTGLINTLDKEAPRPTLKQFMGRIASVTGQ